MRCCTRDELLNELTALPMLHIDTAVERRALDAQRQLARAGTIAFRPSISSSPN